MTWILGERRHWVRFALLLIMVVVVVQATAGDIETAQPAVELSVNTTQVQVGDPLIATVVYRWPRGWTPLIEPDPSSELASVFVTDLPPVSRQDSGAEQRRTYRITVVATHSGPWQLPRPTMRVRPPTGAAMTFTAPVVVVQVGSATGAVALPSARPLWTAPPEPVLSRWWPWFAVTAGLLIGAGAAGWWWLRRRQRTAPIAAIERTRAALTAAVALSDTREAATAISVALRRYAGAVWRFDGAAATTRETAAHLRSLGERVPPDEYHELLRLLHGLDDLRWAPGEVLAIRVATAAAEGRRWADAVQQRCDLANAAAATGATADDASSAKGR